jgi:hypothetical protein
MSSLKIIVAVSSLQHLLFKVFGIVLGRKLLLKLKDSPSQFPITLSGAMVPPFRCDEGVTININDGRIAPGLIATQGTER